MPFDPSTDPHNVTATIWPDPADIPGDLAILKADPTIGDGQVGVGVLTPWQYVILADGTQAGYDAAAAVWVPGATPPRGPFSGAVRADLTTLRAMLGAPTSATSDDDNLDRALSAATEFVYDRTMRCDWDEPSLQYAILLLATRLYQRRKTPEGVAGFASEGVVVRIASTDPDVSRLMERHLEMLTVGVG